MTVLFYLRRDWTKVSDTVSHYRRVWKWSFYRAWKNVLREYFRDKLYLQEWYVNKTATYK